MLQFNLRPLSYVILFYFVSAFGSVAQEMDWKYFEQHNDFSNTSLRQYDQSHIAKCIFGCGNYKPYEFAIEDNGNQFIVLRSKQGQLAQFNNQKKTIKDRIELGTPNNKAQFNIDGETIWYGFRVKLPSGVNKLNSEEIMFSQMKQILKDTNKKDCHYQPMFKIKVRKDLTTYYKVINRKNDKLAKGDLSRLNENWSKFILGMYFDKSNGWIKIYQNGKLKKHFKGPTLYDPKPKDCKVRDGSTNYIRIGVYRGTEKNAVGGDYANKYDELHFDDFIISKSQENVIQALK